MFSMCQKMIKYQTTLSEITKESWSFKIFHVYVGSRTHKAYYGMVLSVHTPGRTSFGLSIKHLLPFDGKTFLTLFAKPSRNRQTILQCRQFRIRTSFRILKVGLLRRGLFFSGNE
jgi:hypothetical protein